MEILVLDDDPKVCAAIAELLTREGHKVRTAEMGSQALQMALSHDYDVLITDVLLPDLGGVEVIGAIKAQAPQLPVIVLSGAPPEDWQKPCEDAGAACYLQKPARPSDILREVSLIQKARLALRVALVDRDSIHRTRITKVLTSLGCTIDAYSNAAEAMESANGQTPPSLWVCDAHDPDVFKLLENVSVAHVPVFAFASQSDAGHEENLMRAGCALFLAKPIDIDTLLTQASFLAR